MSILRRVKNWGVKMWLVISLLMGIATLTIGSHGVSKINADRNAKMLDRTKYLATFIYEIVTACLKIVDPLLGLACLYTRKKIYLKIFLVMKTVLISSQLVGTTYLYTIRLNFEQLTNTRYEACYYKIGNDTECTEAWQSLENTYKKCGNAMTSSKSVSAPGYLYFLKEQDQQQTHLWQLIESLPTLVKNTDEIIDNTTINGKTTNVFSWWNNVANTTQTIYDEYLRNMSVVTSFELDRLIHLIPENLQNISFVINRTTITGGGSTTTPDIGLSTMVTNLVSDYSMTAVNTVPTSSPTDTSLFLSSPTADITPEMLTEVTHTSPMASSLITSNSSSSEKPYSTVHTSAFFITVSEVVREQSTIQYTTNVRQWWNPFKQLLLDIENEYQKMIAIRSLPPSPPPECQQDLYYMRYIATDLTVSVVIYSLNMITDVVGFMSIYKLSSSLMKLTDMNEVHRF